MRHAASISTAIAEDTVVQKAIDKLLGRIADAERASEIADYEALARRWNATKLIGEESGAVVDQPWKASEDLFERAFEPLTNPCKIFKNSLSLAKVTILGSACLQPVAQDETRGVRP